MRAADSRCRSLPHPNYLCQVSAWLSLVFVCGSRTSLAGAEVGDLYPCGLQGPFLLEAEVATHQVGPPPGQGLPQVHFLGPSGSLRDRGCCAQAWRGATPDGQRSNPLDAAAQQECDLWVFSPVGYQFSCGLRFLSR